MKLKSILVAAALALCAGVGLRSFAASDPMDAVDTVTPGVWCSNFTAAKAYADEKNVPMLIFWANPGCSQCAKLESACKSDDFKAWMTETKMVFVFSYGATTADTKACKEFVKNDSKEFPYIGVYWKANTAGEEVLEKFTGRTGKMMGVSKSLDLDEQLMLATSTILADWEPTGDDPEPEPEPEAIRVGGEFVVPDVEGSRLEAIVGVTQSVEVPLVRTNASCVVTNVLLTTITKTTTRTTTELPMDGGVSGGAQVVNQSTVTVTYTDKEDVIWNVGELNKSVTVDTSEFRKRDDSVSGVVVETTETTIDSLDLTQIIAGLDDAFDVHITTADIEPENFNSTDAMLALVHRLQAEK